MHIAIADDGTLLGENDINCCTSVENHVHNVYWALISEFALFGSAWILFCTEKEDHANVEHSNATYVDKSHKQCLQFSIKTNTKRFSELRLRSNPPFAGLMRGELKILK